jgi:hypothetical protein
MDHRRLAPFGLGPPEQRGTDSLRQQQRQRDGEQQLALQTARHQSLHQAEALDAPDIGGQHVAAAPHGLDQGGIAAVGLDLAAQAADLVVDRAVEQVRLAALDHVEQPVAVEHLAGVLEEGGQQAEFDRGNRHHHRLRDRSAGA